MRIETLQDIVVDTNVLVHATNSKDPHFADAVDFVKRLQASATMLAMDSGFDAQSAKNKSLLGGEYLGLLKPMTVSYMALVHLATHGRIRECSTQVSDAQRKYLNNSISNKRDRTFVRVALNSTERVLVSHDFVDFTAPFRVTVAQQWNVKIVKATDC